MKFLLYNVSILTCCLFIFSSCSKSPTEPSAEAQNQEETQSPSNNDEVKVAEKKETEESQSTAKLPTEKKDSSTTTEIKQPEISIPDEPEETEEEKSVATPAEVLAFVGKMKESGIPKLVAELEELEELGRESPGLAFDALRELAAKTSVLDSGDLPEDLRTEFDALNTGLNQMVSHIEASPIPADIMADGEQAIGAWFLEQSQADPDFGQDFGEKMRSWGGEMEELGRNLESAGEGMGEIFEKYGIEESDLLN